ncbi:MAG: hypothetical protein IJ007_04430 [Oscillospiraceae bacterium]|nr:hypothetical protein [Oscillospiraceae bacterium]
MNGYDFLSQYIPVCERIRLNKESMLRAEHRSSELGGKAEKWSSDYQDRLYAETEELIKLRYVMENCVERCRCSETEREVLFKRYIQGKKWTEIAAEMLYSLQHLHRLNVSALKKIKVPSEWQSDSTYGR